MSDSQSEYRKGTMLGLTIAEIMLLLLFLLLLVLSFLLDEEKKNAEKIAELTKEYRTTYNNLDEDITLQKKYKEVISVLPELYRRFENTNSNITSKEKIGSTDTISTVYEDDAGNVIGYSNDDKNIYDFDGKKIAEIDKNGDVILDNGEVANKSDDLSVVVDKDGNTIGYEDKNNFVRDKNGNVIGKTDDDGYAYNFEILDTEKNANKIIIGFVDNQIAYDFNNNIIGRLLQNRIVVDNNNNIIGKTSDRTTIIKDTQNNISGYLTPSGIIRSTEGNKLGITLPNGDVFDVNDKIGEEKDSSSVIHDENGIIIALVKQNNVIVDFKGNEIGSLGFDGKAYNVDNEWIGHQGLRHHLLKNKDNHYIGYIKGNTAYNFHHKTLGKLSENGKLFSQKTFIGKNNDLGKLILKNNDVIGYVYKDKPVLADKGEYIISGQKVLNKNKKEIAKLSDPIFLITNKENPIGFEKDNYVINFKNQKIGILDNIGDAWSSDFEHIKKIDDSYVVNLKEIKSYDSLSNKDNWIEKRNVAYSEEGKKIGFEDDNNNLINNHGNLGTVNLDGEVVFNDQVLKIKDNHSLIEPIKKENDFATVMNAALDCLDKNKVCFSKSLEMEKKNKELSSKISKLEIAKNHYKKQADNLLAGTKGKGGLDYPPCYVNANGKTIPLYRITLRDDTFLIEQLIEKEDLLKNFKSVPLFPRGEIAQSEFETFGKTFLNWENTNECRFHAIIKDEVSFERHKTLYSKLDKLVQTYFYPFRHED